MFEAEPRLRLDVEIVGCVTSITGREEESKGKVIHTAMRQHKYRNTTV